MVLSLTDGLLLLWWAAAESKPVWLWESVSEPFEHVDWEREREVDAKKVNDAAGVGVYTSTHSECKPVFQWAWVW